MVCFKQAAQGRSGTVYQFRERKMAITVATTDHASPADHDDASIIRPIKLAHFVLRTSRYDETIAWYKLVLGARAAFENELLSFLSYDGEHHRIAILHVPDLADQTEGIAGVQHVAFTYGSLSELLAHYERLRDHGIKPIFVINHGPTTSLYYRDPDGNQLEFQVENYASVAESTQFFYSEEFAENPVGVEFDPEDHLARLRAGESEEALKKRPRAGAKGLGDIKLR
jgi:catechol 2,3-dioxygenase-like lactoylglutathione lyase family enzyme